MSVYKKLNEARAKFHQIKLTKTGQNKFANYSYFELGDFLIPALQVFNEVGLCAVVSFDEKMATMTITDTDGGGAITITSPLSEAALKGCHPVQNVGACETYARRYLWVAALEIVEHDALDATTGKGSVKVSGPAEIFKSLQPEIQDLLRRAAPKIDATMPDIKLVMDRVTMLLETRPEEERNDMKAGLFHLLDSKTRAAIKDYEENEA